MKKQVIPAICMAVVSSLCVGAAAYMYPAPAYQLDAAGTPVVMTVDGSAVHANEYASYLLTAKNNFESQLAQFGMDPSMIWEDPTMLDNARQSAQDMVTQYRVVVDQFEKDSLSLNKLQIDEMKRYKKSVVDQFDMYSGVGSFRRALDLQGLSEQMYDNSLLVSAYAQALNAYYFGENGKLMPSEQAMTDYYKQNYLQAKHVLIGTIDETGMPLEGEALEQKRTLAEQVLEKARGGEDFDALVAEFGEDPGMASSPQGYIFPEGQMVDEFYQGTKALAEGEVSDIIESDFGFHIIKRLPLDESKSADFQADLVSAVAGKDFPTLMQEWAQNAKVDPIAEELSNVTLDNAYDLAMAGVPAAPEVAPDVSAPSAPPQDAPATAPDAGSADAPPAP